jgi:hypothetical protein
VIATSWSLGVKRWGTKDLSGAQIEAGVMPWATHRLTDHQPLGKRPVIVGAVRRDREDLLSRPRQENCLAVRVANQHLAIAQALSRNAFGKIRSTQLGLALSQASSPGEE